MRTEFTEMFLKPIANWVISIEICNHFGLRKLKKQHVHSKKMVIQDLKEKWNKPQTLSDEFMYQDKEEAMKELKVAEMILKEMPKPIQ